MIEKSYIDTVKQVKKEISPLPTDQFSDNFIKVSFTAYYKLMN